MREKIIEWGDVIAECTHTVRLKELPLELIGVSRENGIALVYCHKCEKQLFIEFEYCV